MNSCYSCNTYTVNSNRNDNLQHSMEVYGNFYYGDATLVYGKMLNLKLVGKLNLFLEYVQKIRNLLRYDVIKSNLDPIYLPEYEIDKLYEITKSLSNYIVEQDDYVKDSNSFFCEIDFSEAYSNIRFLKAFVNLDREPQNKFSKRQINTPITDFAKQFLDATKINNKVQRNDELNALLIQIQNMDANAIRANAMTLGPETVLRNPFIDIETKRFQFSSHLISTYNIEGRSLRRRTTRFPTINTSVRPTLTTTTTSSVNEIVSAENSVVPNTNPSDSSKRPLDETLRIEQDKRPRLNSNEDEFLDNVNNPFEDSLIFDENNQDGNSRKFSDNGDFDTPLPYYDNVRLSNQFSRRQSLGDELQDASLFDAESKKNIRDRSIKVRENIEILQNFFTLFKNKLSKITISSIKELCSVDVARIVEYKGQTLLLFKEQIALKLIPVPVCGRNNCFSLNTFSEMYRIESGEFCTASNVIHNIVLCTKLKQDWPTCTFSLPSQICKFEPVDINDYYVLNNNSAMHFPSNNTMIQNTHPNEIIVGGVKLNAPVSPLFAIDKRLTYIYTTDQIDKNFFGQTFIFWAKENVNFLLTLRPLEYGLIGTSVFSTLFGIIQVILYIKFRYFDNKKKTDRRNDDMELREQNRSLLRKPKDRN